MPDSVQTVSDILDPPPAGHNQPPLAELLPEETVTLHARAEELIASAGRAAIVDDETAGKVTLLGKMLAEHIKTTDSSREQRKAPFLEAGRTVDAHYRAILDPLTTAKKKLADLMTAWLRKKEQEAAAERRRLAVEALQQQAEANKQAAIAEATGNVAASAAAADTAAHAAELADQARAVTPVVVDSGLGAKAHGRTVTVVTLTDLREAVLHMLVVNEPEVRAFVQTHYERMARAKIRSLPGAAVTEEKAASFR